MKKVIFPITLLALSFILPTAAHAADSSQIVGRWLRHDGGYALEFRNIEKDGTIEAYYYNPRPINVSVARTDIKDDIINIFVELRDKGYPGSYYTLEYEPEKDILIGVYHHLGINQNFQVYFVRQGNQ